MVTARFILPVRTGCASAADREIREPKSLADFGHGSHKANICFRPFVKFVGEDPMIPLWPSTDDELETDVGQDALSHLDHAVRGT